MRSSAGVQTTPLLNNSISSNNSSRRLTRTISNSQVICLNTAKLLGQFYLEHSTFSLRLSIGCLTNQHLSQSSVRNRVLQLMWMLLHLTLRRWLLSTRQRKRTPSLLRFKLGKRTSTARYKKQKRNGLKFVWKISLRTLCWNKSHLTRKKRSDSSAIIQAPPHLMTNWKKPKTCYLAPTQKWAWIGSYTTSWCKGF